MLGNLGNESSDFSGMFRCMCLMPIVFPSLLLAAGILYTGTSAEALSLLGKKKKLKFSMLTVVQLGICWPETLEQLFLLSMHLSLL